MSLRKSLMVWPVGKCFKLDGILLNQFMYTFILLVVALITVQIRCTVRM